MFTRRQFVAAAGAASAALTAGAAPAYGPVVGRERELELLDELRQLTAEAPLLHTRNWVALVTSPSIPAARSGWYFAHLPERGRLDEAEARRRLRQREATVAAVDRNERRRKEIERELGIGPNRDSGLPRQSQNDPAIWEWAREQGLL